MIRSVNVSALIQSQDEGERVVFQICTFISCDNYPQYDSGVIRRIKMREC
jgi:hypothetical protein